MHSVWLNSQRWSNPRHSGRTHWMWTDDLPRLSSHCWRACKWGHRSSTARWSYWPRCRWSTLSWSNLPDPPSSRTDTRYWSSRAAQTSCLWSAWLCPDQHCQRSTRERPVLCLSVPFQSDLLVAYSVGARQERLCFGEGHY